MYRQGDLLFVRAEIPTEAVSVADGVIARGEASGHAHRLRAGRGRVLMIAAGLMYIRARYRAMIDHEEHAQVTLPAGDWAVIRQREYEPTGWRQVAD